MKITVGLGRVEDFERYADAGADEVFCGWEPLEWRVKYGVISPVNRREVLLYPVQISALADMKLLARLSERRGVPVSVAFNATCYAPAQYGEIAGMIESLMDIGIERFILADPALILRLRARGRRCQIHLSGEFGELNEGVSFARDVGAARIIFHRRVSPAEMAALIRANPGMEYEAFALNERCFYTGAFCQSLHCDELPHICRVPHMPGGVSRPLGEAEAAPPDEPDMDGLGAGGCGLCALKRLQSAGITHLKLVGRGNRPERMERDIRALRRALETLDAPDYEQAMKAALFPEGCGGACYY